jgi:hypothetical protein
MCVLSMHSSRGRLRTMCGSRTGGWSLPGVMSDWQHCVDWFFAKNCRCRLRLDWCWCRWTTSANGRCQWGLQVWRSQVGFVRGTRWPVESSAGRMMARTARWSHGRFLGWASKPRSSQDYVGAESWVAIAEATPSSRGFMWFTRKPLGSLADPQSQDRRTEDGGLAASDRSDWWVWPVWPVRSTGLTGVRWRIPETSKRRTRVGIARLAPRLSKFAVAGHLSDGAMSKTSEFALEGHVSLVS